MSCSNYYDGTCRLGGNDVECIQCDNWEDEDITELRERLSDELVAECIAEEKRQGDKKLERLLDFISDPEGLTDEEIKKELIADAG